MLEGVPDLRHALRDADEAELIEMFDAFDVTATYWKDSRRLELTATVTPELLSADQATSAIRRRSQDLGIAGAGFEPATFGL
jgi:hypothetical protein